MTARRDLPADPSFARQVEQCEIEAWLDLDQSGEGARQLELQPVDDAIVMLDRSLDWPHSRIFNLGVTRPATAEVIQSILNITRAAGITTLMTDISPIARPGTISRLLNSQGFRQTERTVTVARHTAGMDEPDSYFRIRPAGSDDREAMIALMQDAMPGARDWSNLLAGQVSRPNWLHYLAMEEGVACGMSATHIHNDMVWLAPIWVGRQHRNRGTQAALIAHSVREAEAHGVQWVVTSYPATTPGRTRNFERLGFSLVYLRNRFVWQSDNG